MASPKQRVTIAALADAVRLYKVTRDSVENEAYTKGSVSIETLSAHRLIEYRLNSLLAIAPSQIEQPKREATKNVSAAAGTAAAES